MREVRRSVTLHTAANNQCVRLVALEVLEADVDSMDDADYQVRVSTDFCIKETER